MPDITPVVIFMERMFKKYGLWQLVAAAASLILLWKLPDLLALFL